MLAPEWAHAENGGRAPVVELRNNAIHEALFMDQPLGFAIHGVGSNQNLPLEMSALVYRLVVALFGGEAAPYVRSPVNTRSRYGLTLP